MVDREDTQQFYVDFNGELGSVPSRKRPGNGQYLHAESQYIAQHYIKANVFKICYFIGKWYIGGRNGRTDSLPEVGTGAGNQQCLHIAAI